MDPQSLSKLEDTLLVMAQGFVRLTEALFQTVQAAGLLADRLATLAGMPAAAPTRGDGEAGNGEGKPEPKSLAKPLAEVKTLRDLARAYGQEQVANDAQAVMNSLGDIGRTADGIILQVSGVFFEKLKGPLEEFAKWFDTHGPLIGKRLSEVAGAALDMALRIAPVLGWIGSLFLDLDDATGGWSTRILIAVAAFRMLGGAELVNGLVALANAIGLVNAASQGLGAAGGLGGVLQFLRQRKLLALGAAGAMTEAALSLTEWMQPAIPGESEDDRKARNSDQWLSTFPFPGLTMAQKLAVDMLMLSDTPAAPGSSGVKVGPSSFPDLKLPRPNFDNAAESPVELPAAADAVPGAVAPDASRMIERADLAARAAGESFQRLIDGMPASSRELILSSGNVNLRLPNFGEPMPQVMSAPWEGYRSGAPTRLDVQLNVESPQVNLNATTHIYLEGAADPMATATAVAAQQDRVFADLTRNTQGAYQ